MSVLEGFNSYIFDLDGTLIDSMKAWDNVGYDFLLANGIEPPEDLDERLKTMSFEEAAEYFINSLGLDMNVLQAVKGVTETVADKYRFDIELKPYVYEFLEKNFRSGKNMCILTASEEYYVTPLLRRLKIDGFFERLITCTDISMSKSSYEIYERAAEMMGYTKDTTAVFEDAYHGVINSKKAGFFTVGVYDEAEESNIERIYMYTALMKFCNLRK